MRLDHLEERVELPEGVKVAAAGDMINAEGPKGKLSRKIMSSGLILVQEGNVLKITVMNASKREKTTLGTFKAHLKNMITGVKEGFTYKMKICSGHFPMTVMVKGDEFIVKNYLGEKTPRVLRIKPGAEVKVEGDIVVISSLNRELAGQTAASIEDLTARADYDKRVFQDGIYIIDKAGKEIK
jgi:large subunit ribosomal protein L6